MKKLSVMYADDEILERIYEAKVFRRNSCSLGHSNSHEDTAFPLADPADYESRITTGFRFFEMPENGYPED